MAACASACQRYADHRHSGFILAFLRKWLAAAAGGDGISYRDSLPGNAAKSQTYGAILRDIARAERSGVRPIVMRGMAFLLESGCNTGRLLSDIDLLLPGERREQSVEALLSLGFQTFQGFHGPPFSVVLGRGQDTGMVDLHTELQPYSLGINFDRLAPLCRPLTLECGEVLLPSPTCALIMFILHDQLHDADYWRGLIDVRHLIETRTLAERGVDWPTLASFLPAGAATNAMHVYLRTAKTLLGTEIPEEYCGGAWARLQVRRRLFQMRVPALRSSLTFLTALVDAPLASAKTYRPRRSTKRTLQFKIGRALRPVNPGKI